MKLAFCSPQGKYFRPSRSTRFIVLPDRVGEALPEQLRRLHLGKQRDQQAIRRSSHQSNVETAAHAGTADQSATVQRGSSQVAEVVTTFDATSRPTKPHSMQSIGPRNSLLPPIHHRTTTTPIAVEKTKVDAATPASENGFSTHSRRAARMGSNQQE